MIGRWTAIAALVATTAAGAPSRERRIEVSKPGPQRLDVDLALLAGSESNLADVRIYDAARREVPYLLVPPPAGEPQWMNARRFSIASTKTTSGAEGDLGFARLVDAVRVGGVSSPFLKRVRIEGSGDRTRWTVLSTATVFDLPDDKLTRRIVEFPPVEIRYIRLTWDDTSSARVGGRETIELRLHGSAAPAAPLRAGLPVQKRPSEPGKTRYRLRLPAIGLPLRAVEIPVSGDVFRSVAISEPRLDSSEITPFNLGAGQIRQASRDGLVASDTRIRVAPPRSAELNVTIDDGSNDPLEIDRVIIELEPQPWIYFEAKSAGAFIVRFGDPRAKKPRYDLEAARELIGRAPLPKASWSAQVPVQLEDEFEEAPLPVVGGKLDRKKFTVERRIAPAGRGMSTLPLDADVLARSRELADVRLVDAKGRQVPFVIERREEPLTLALSIGPRQELDDNVSSYVLKVPYATLPAGSRIVLTTDAGVFERDVTLSMQPNGTRDARVIARSAWRHTDPDSRAPVLTFDVPRQVTRDLELEIDEGDNAPLPIKSAKLLMAAHALRFHHPGTPLTLVYGNPEAAPPRYDLALLAPRLFREPAQRVYFAGAIAPGATDEGGVERHFFWIAIGAVALILMLLLARLLSGLTPSQK